MPRLSRKAYEKILGVELKDDEEVHHKNDNIDDNGKSNLEVLTIKEHEILRFKGRNAMYKYRKKNATDRSRTNQ